MNEFERWLLDQQLRRGEYVVLWVPWMGCFVEFNHETQSQVALGGAEQAAQQTQGQGARPMGPLLAAADRARRRGAGGIG